MEEKRLKDYIAAMEPEDYEEQFANIANEEKELRKFLKKSTESMKVFFPK